MVPTRNNPFSYRIEDDVCGALQAKLLHEIGTMTFNSLRAEVQQTGNIFVRLTLRNQLQHSLFPLGKQVIRVMDMLMPKPSALMRNDRPVLARSVHPPLI